MFALRENRFLEHVGLLIRGENIQVGGLHFGVLLPRKHTCVVQSVQSVRVVDWRRVRGRVEDGHMCFARGVRHNHVTLRLRCDSLIREPGEELSFCTNGSCPSRKRGFRVGKRSSRKQLSLLVHRTRSGYEFVIR